MWKRTQNDLSTGIFFSSWLLLAILFDADLDIAFSPIDVIGTTREKSCEAKGHQRL